MAAGGDSRMLAGTPRSLADDLGSAGARRRRSRFGGFAVVAVVAVALLVLAGALFGPIPVHVDGRALWVARSSTPARLVRSGALAVSSGDLVSVKGAVLRRGGGQPPDFEVGGALVSSTTALGFGADLTATRGGNVTESVVTTVVEITAPVDYRGTGAVVTVETSGVPGIARVVMGSISHEIVSRTVLQAPVAMVVRSEPDWSGAKVVALTFDDGPWPAQTLQVLGILTANKVKATFFEIGYLARRYPNLSKQVVADGMEIGDHTESHKLLDKATHAVITSQIAQGQDDVQKASGVRPLWFRPPGGDMNAFVISETKRLGMRLVLWTVDPNDWKRPGAKVIEQRVLDAVKPGSIILMHDGGGDRSQTIAALPVIIKALKARGYSMVTLTQLYGSPDAPKAG